MAMPDTPALAEAAVDGGADLLEIGFPFSDPLADGPVIRLAGERALAAGMRTRACLDCLREVRARVGDDVPLIPMTYSSILEAYGYERFWIDARGAGATSLIVADLPLEAAPELPRVQLVAPTSSPERIRQASQRTDGWLYLVSLTGTTGARDALSDQLADLVATAREVTDVPLLAGFGIATPEQAARAAGLADGIVVGSRAVEVADEGGPKCSPRLRRVAAARGRRPVSELTTRCGRDSPGRIQPRPKAFLADHADLLAVDGRIARPDDRDVPAAPAAVEAVDRSIVRGREEPVVVRRRRSWRRRRSRPTPSRDHPHPQGCRRRARPRRSRPGPLRRRCRFRARRRGSRCRLRPRSCRSRTSRR